MNKNYRAFRLINQADLRKIDQHVKTCVMNWNQQYAYLPLNYILKPTSKNRILNINEWQLVSFNAQPQALISLNNACVLSLSLFGELCPNFTVAIETPKIQLIEALLKSTSVEFQPLDYCLFNKNEWFYHGAPSVELQFNIKHPSSNQYFTLYIHPLWVLNFLPQTLAPKKPEISLKAVLKEQAINCQVELQAFSLNLKESSTLKIGDVIKTDHAVTQPVLLTHHKKTLLSANLGKTNDHQSIQIVSSI